MNERLGREVYEMVQQRRTRLISELRDLEPLTKDMTQLEVLWHKLKFVVLEGSPNGYFRIRAFFINYSKGVLSFSTVKNSVFKIFYEALNCPIHEENMVNLLTHIWGYLKKHVQEEAERERALDLIARLSDGELEVAKTVFDYFTELHVKYGKENLMNPSLK